MRKHKKAQSTLEYAVLIAVVVAAFLIMSIYMKRGVSGSLQSSADDLGEQFHITNTSGGIRKDYIINPSPIGMGARSKTVRTIVDATDTTDSKLFYNETRNETVDAWNPADNPLLRGDDPL